MIAVLSVPMPIMQVVHVVVVLNRLVAAVGAVDVLGVRMGVVFGISHRIEAINNMHVLQYIHFDRRKALTIGEPAVDRGHSIVVLLR